ncbi:MAG: tetratricopeptide repeat protein, partial [candidate division Zixibacteria bacterium]|nr:tetratricopeptide repeat protein [candidate division Zixibacteria bacterium]
LIIAVLVFKPWKFEISPTQEAQDALAVMYFDNLKEPSDTARLGEIAANLVITNLSDVKQIKVLSSQRLYDILKRFGKEGAHVIDRGTASEVAKEANAKWMLTGTILQIEPLMIITTQVIDVASGQALSSQRINGEPGEDIFVIVDRLTIEIQKDMALPVSPNGSAEFTGKGTKSQEAYRYYLEGIEFNNKYYGLEAQASFLKAIALDSTFAMAYFYLTGDNLNPRQREYVRKAVKYSHHATELQKTYILAKADAVAGDVSSAIAALEKSVAEHPDDKTSYKMLGSLYLFTTPPDMVSSIKNLEKIIELDPLDAPIYNVLAYRYKALREYDRALEYIDQYVNLVPDEPNPYDSHGDILLALGKFDEAIAAYRKALEIDPGFKGSLNAIARVYCHLGDYETADSCARALAADAVPNVRARGRFLLSRILYAQGKFAEGWKLADEATTANRIDRVTGSIYPLTHIVKGYTMHFMGMKEEALKAVEEANLVVREIVPSRPVALEHFRAMIYMETGEPERAESILRSLEAPIEKVGSRFDKAFQKLMWGKLALVRENYDTAIALMIEAADIDRLLLGTWCEYDLAKTYIQAGQPGKAIPLLERRNTTIESLFNRPPFRTALGHYYLGQAYEADGQKKKAVESYETFLTIWKNADPGIKDMADARERLAKLKHGS